MFYVVNLDVRQSKQANDGANIVKCTKKDFAIVKVRESTAGGQMPQLLKEFESVNKLLLFAQNWAPGLDISSL